MSETSETKGFPPAVLAEQRLWSFTLRGTPAPTVEDVGLLIEDAGRMRYQAAILLSLREMAEGDAPLQAALAEAERRFREPWIAQLKAEGGGAN